MSREYHRRELPRLLLGLGVVGFAAERQYRDMQPVSEPEGADRFVRPFEGKRANDIAERLGITAGSFWRIDRDVLDGKTQTPFTRSGAFLRERTLLPIYPAAINNQRFYHAKVASELDVPINVVATIGAVESAGFTKARSEADAHGTYQVVPLYHIDKIVSVAAEAGKPVPGGEELVEKWNKARKSGQDLPNVTTDGVIEALRDPYIGCKVGMSIVKGYHSTIVKNTGLPPDSPLSWARALAAYNGGVKAGSNAYEAMPFESQMYMVHAMRYFMTAEIASQLKNTGVTMFGLSDSVIATEMVSREIDARAFAYRQSKSGRLTNKIGSYERLWDALSSPTIGSDTETSQLLRQNYNYYKESGYSFNLPLSPGLRLWLVHNGDSLFVKAPENEIPTNYPGR